MGKAWRPFAIDALVDGVRAPPPLASRSACGVSRVTLPRWLMPIAVCFERGGGDKFVFDIDAAFRVIGPVIHYRGWLLPKD